MSQSAVIGTWVEAEPRTITSCPSYYAADSETIRTKPGRYELRLVFVGGYTVPMPYWLVAGIAADRIDGRLYSGFGGVNYASTELPKEPTTYHLQTYSFHLDELVSGGRVELLPGFEWLLTERPWSHANAPKTWKQVEAL